LTLFQIEVDDVEEWTIEAIADKIIDAKIDQLNEEIVIMSTIKRKIDNEEWAAVQTKIQAWKHRF
jgi:alpha-N-acetylglucosamine transferase